jgi:3-oxoadipate CoA-transferase beta subunit
MDLAVGARRVFILMEHNAKDGSPKILPACTLPLTGMGVVSRIYTDLAVLEVTPAGLQVLQMNDGLTFDELQAHTGARLLPLDA